MPSLASQNREFYAPEIEVLIDGEIIDRSQVYVSKMEVDLSCEAASLFSMRIANVMSSTLEFTEPWPFKMGARIKIRAGYRSGLEDLIDGVITAVTYHYGTEGHLGIDVEGSDLLFLLMKQYHQRSFSEMTDSDVVAQVLSDYGLQSDIEDSSISYNFIQQDHESDFAFLTRLAKRNGFEFYTNGESICFKSPNVDASPSQTFTFGLEPMKFSCRHDITQQFENVTTHGWDDLNKVSIEAEASIGEVENVESSWDDASSALEHLELSDISYPEAGNYDSTESAQRGADALMQRFSYSLVKGKGSTAGVPALRPANTVEMAGFSAQLNGIYYLTRVIHRIGREDGFTTYFEVKGNRIHESL